MREQQWAGIVFYPYQLGIRVLHRNVVWVPIKSMHVTRTDFFCQKMHMLFQISFWLNYIDVNFIDDFKRMSNLKLIFTKFLVDYEAQLNNFRQDKIFVLFWLAIVYIALLYKQLMVILESKLKLVSTRTLKLLFFETA